MASTSKESGGGGNTIKIKTEPTESMEEIQKRIQSILESSQAAISEEELSMRMSDVNKMTRIMALNDMIKENRVKILTNNKAQQQQQQNNNNQQPQVWYELVVEEQSPDDLVYAVVRDSGREGIWIRDIRFKTKLSQIVLNKTIKNLETKKLIRPIKSISNRKLYILFDLEPDEAVTGGACYDSGFIREDVVKNLKSACFQYMFDRFQESYHTMMNAARTNDDNQHDDDQFSLEKLYATASDVFRQFASRNMFQDIKLVDIEQILNILTYECKLKKMSINNNQKTLYRYNPYNRDKTDLFYAPCMVCHLYKDCKPGSVNIAPEKCHYLSVERF